MFRSVTVLWFLVGTALAVAPGSAEAGDPPALSDLKKARVETARLAYEASFQALNAGKVDAERVYLWSVRLLEAQRDLSDKEAERLTALEGHLDRMKGLRKVAEARYKLGQTHQGEVFAADYYIAEAEIWLARVKAR
jgi:hypothetical protein